MGIGFVILIHLIGIFILSAAIALVSGLITYFISAKEKWKRKVILAIISPFVGLYTLYFLALAGSVFVSFYKNVDIGIGDAWYIPLSDHCELLFIDIPELGYIECNDQTIISEVSHIGKKGSIIHGKTDKGKYFSLNTVDNKLREFSNETDFTTIPANEKIPLKDAVDFYYEQRDKIAGGYIIMVGVTALITSVLFLFMLKRIVLGPSSKV